MNYFKNKKALLIISFFVLNIQANLIAQPAKLKILASFSPYASLIADIGADFVVTEPLLESGHDMHFSELKPSTLKKISQADMFFISKQEYERSILADLKRLNHTLIIIDLNRDLSTEEDIHTFFSPVWLKKQTSYIFDALVRKLPVAKDDLQANLARVNAQIDDIFNQSAADFAAYKNKFIFSYHSITYYLAHYFGFEDYALTAAHYEPSVYDFNIFNKLLKAHSAKFILITEDWQQDKLQKILDSTGAVAIKIKEFDKDWQTTLQGALNSIKKGFTIK